jgi:hypothetical protein
MGDVVWILAYTHRHGDDITVHRTQESAFIALSEICDEYWDEAVERAEDPESITKPSDRQQKIDLYFDLMRDDEFWSIDFRDVLDKSLVITEEPEITDVL